jgi:hypothetical protein
MQSAPEPKQRYLEPKSNLPEATTLLEAVMSGSATGLDQSYCVSTSSNLKILTDLETLVANYATDVGKGMWLENNDGNAGRFSLHAAYADTNPVICPRDRIVTGIALYQKGNRLALKLQYAKPGGSDRQWLQNDVFVADNTYFYIGGKSPDFYADSSPLICPPGYDVTGAALRLRQVGDDKRSNRLALKLQIAKAGKDKLDDRRWILNDDPDPGNDCFPEKGSALSYFDADTNELTCPAGAQLRGIAFWRKLGGGGNHRVAFKALLRGAEIHNSTPIGHEILDAMRYDRTVIKSDLKAADVAEAYPSAIPKAENDRVTVVETSESLTLTQMNTENIRGCFPVSSNSHLIVFGNEVCIQGKISVPGKHIVIFARELRTLAVKYKNDKGEDVHENAELNVDGTQLVDGTLPALSPAKDGEAGAAAVRRQRYGASIFGLFKILAQYTNDGNDLPGLKGWSADANPLRVDPGHPEMHGKDGGRGEEGNPGGDISILCGRVQNTSDLTLSACGGAGGQGRAGQRGGKGGPGGPGADFWQQEPSMNQAYQLTYSALAGGPGGNGGHGGIGGPGGTGGRAGNCTLIVNDALGQNTTITYSGKPGDAGLRGWHGEGGAAGDNGRDGAGRYADSSGIPPNRNNYWNTVVFRGLIPESGKSGAERFKEMGSSLPPELVDPPPAKWGRYLLVHDVDAVPATSNDAVEKLRGFARVSHLHMIFETARERYLEWDAFRINGETANADAKKKELLALFDFLDLGARLLPKYSSTDDKRVRDDIAATLASLKRNLALDLDYFGHSQDFVPLGSPDFYLQPFNDELGFLKERETTYYDYTQALKDKINVNDQRFKAIRQADANITTLEQNLNQLKITLTGLIKTDIPNADKAIGEAKTKLQDKLGNLTNEIKTTTGLTPEDFIDCLFNLAFAGSPETGHGAFTMFTTLTSQSAKLISKAIDTLPNDEGQPVQKKHMLFQVDRLTNDITKLNEAWTTIKTARAGLETAQLNDPDAYRLLMTREKFDNLLEQFSTMGAVQSAKDALDNYVDAVQQRNAVLADYNTLITEYLRVMGELETTKAQKDDVEQLRANTAQPNLPAETAFVTALYNRSRERCIEYCYLASRAYRFWTLQPDNELASVLKLGSPNEINFQLLSGVVEALYQKRTEQIWTSLSKTVQDFPPKEADYKGTGICVVANSRTHRQAIADLKKNGVASFTIAAPTQNSTVSENPFSLHANVRISRVRIWVMGVNTTDRMCRVRARHKGYEVVRAVNKALVPFSHEPVDLVFVYDWTKVLWNMQGEYVENPEPALLHASTDGDLTYKGDYAGSRYLPLIGPFAEWEITVSDKDNKGLDRSKITAICFDFHGFSQTPKQ